jgi:sec-independent protein translocase protein TatB
MNFGLSEMFFLAVLGLLLVGPKKLPELARQIGFWISEFKRVSSGFQQQLTREIQTLETSKSLPAVPRTWSVSNVVSDAPPSPVAAQQEIIPPAMAAREVANG